MNFNLSEWAITNRSVCTFLMILTVVAGAWSYVRLGRSEDPPFTVKVMVVEAYWPGATVEETQQQVTERIEKKLQETPNVDFIRSYTTAGKSTIFVNLKDSTPAKSVPEIWNQVRNKINDIRHTLPKGVVGPGFNDEFGDTFGIIYGFTASGFSHRELRDYVERVRSRLLRVPDVAKIDVIGAQDERIFIDFSTQRLSDLHVDRSALIRALQAQNAITPAGTIRTEEEDVIVRVSGRFTSAEDLRKVNFVINGRLYRLSDLGQVSRSYAAPPQPMFRVNGQPAIGLAISMREGGDMLALGRNIEHAMADITANLPLGIEPLLVANQPEVVSESVHEFMKSLWEAIAIVMIVSLVSLGLRAGTVVALSIPLVLAIVFVAMDVSNISLQRVSLGALIIALGLLVDDAMITVESMVSRLEEGWDKSKAAIYAYATTHFPMGTGTLVTVAGFLPIGLAQSTAGEYTFSLFAVVAISLIVSWFVAAIFAPLIGVVLLKEHQAAGRSPPPGRVALACRRALAMALPARWVPLSPKPKTSHAHGGGRLLRAFRRFLVMTMRARWVTLGLTLGAFAASLAGLALVPQQFFPPSDRSELLVDLKLPQNASIYATERMAARLDNLLRNDTDIERWSTYVGRGAVRFYLPLAAQLPSDFFAQSVLVAKDLEARERVRTRLQQTIQEKFPAAVGRVYPLEMGPPVGWPVQYRVSGPDVNQVRDIAIRLAQMISSSRYLRSVNFDWVESAKTIQIRVDQDQVRMLGISSEALAQSLNTVLSGVDVTQILDGSYLIDVVARSSEEERMSLSTMRNLQLLLPGDRIVPLTQVGTIEYGQEPSLIWRRDRLPTLTVQADVAPGVQAETAVKLLADEVEAFVAKLPADYGVAIGGTTEQSRKSQLSVIAVVPLMLLLMLIILMLQLRSFQRLFLVLSVAPLGLIGVVAALLGSGRPLGFIALLGVVALIGMIVRNSVILVIQIDAEIENGKHPWDGVVEATSNRFRPICLTAAAAILGMIPIAPAVFWGPMAFAIMGGLAVATALTLIFLPTLYIIWFRVKEPGFGVESVPAGTVSA
jgi:multidrug efflux pump subunit AcrB